MMEQFVGNCKDGSVSVSFFLAAALRLDLAELAGSVTIVNFPSRSAGMLGSSALHVLASPKSSRLTIENVSASSRFMVKLNNVG